MPKTIIIEGVSVEIEWADDGMLEVGLPSLQRLVDAGLADNMDSAYDLVWESPEAVEASNEPDS